MYDGILTSSKDKYIITKLIDEVIKNIPNKIINNTIRSQALPTRRTAPAEPGNGQGRRCGGSSRCTVPAGATISADDASAAVAASQSCPEAPAPSLLALWISHRAAGSKQPPSYLAT